MTSGPSFAAAVALPGLWLAILNCGCPPEAAAQRITVSVEAETAADLELARRFAPFLFQETDRKGGRQDLPANVDFDGDLRGDNNWESFPGHTLVPTLYYAVVETETHWFLSYHVFHPRDWSCVRLGLQDVHENDGENLQVVVRKSTGRPELLFTQAHYRGRIHERFRIEEETHPCVFVQTKGHGLYAIPSDCARIDESLRFRSGSGILLRPAGNETCREPEDWTQGVVPYRLESTVRKFWRRLPELCGDGRLFDGIVELRRLGHRFRIPRYYDGDLFSGPLGNDRGISPFALDVSFCSGKVGSLLIDPANRYPELVGPSLNWSRTYVRNPFLEDGGERSHAE